MASSNVMLITGASRGIGAATARSAAAEGWSVAVGYRHQIDAAERVVADCQAAGADAVALQCDVADEASVENFFTAATSALGPPTSLINNAGILLPMARVEDMDAKRLEQIFQVNVVGAFTCARHAVMRMATDHGGDGGTIVNVSSAAAYLGSPNEFVDYAATKGAIDTFTIGLAREVADRGIRVNAVRPGLIDTEIHADSGQPERFHNLGANVPMKRGGHADEVASVILYLAGPASSYVCGALVNVSGGR